MVLAHQFRDVRDGAAHRHALDPQVFLGQVIIHDDHRVTKAAVFVFAQIDRPGTRIAGAHNEQRDGMLAAAVIPLAVLGLQGKASHQSPEQADAAHKGNIEYRPQHQHGAVKHTVQHEVDQHDNAGCQARQQCQSGQVPHAGVLPQDLIQPAEPEYQKVDQQDIGHPRRHGVDNPDALVGIHAVKSQHDGDQVGQCDQHTVQRHQRHTARQTSYDLFVVLLHLIVFLVPVRKKP